jgi:hypothetical protein
MKKKAKMKRLAVMNKYLRDIRAHGLRIQVTFRYWRDPEWPPGPQAVWTVTWTDIYDKRESVMDTSETIAFLRGAAWAASLVRPP